MVKIVVIKAINVKVTAAHVIYLEIMTKLLEWLTFAAVAFGIWFSIVFKYVNSAFFDKWMYLIIPSPVIFVALFGVYAITVILYRVFTFNDCKYAAEELQEQIVEARKDLETKGFKF